MQPFPLRPSCRSDVGVYRRTWPVIFVPLLFATTLQAQWLEQRIELVEGWNSVYLIVDPAPEQADLLFEGGDIEAVWAYSSRPLNPTVPNCPQPSYPDPDCPSADVRHWQVWVPSIDGGALVNSLQIIRGGRVYQIKATRDTTLAIVGRPHAKKTKWRAGLNLVGFHVEAESAPVEPPLSDGINFAEYLLPSPVHANSRVFQNVNGGNWLEIAVDTPIRAGKGYWVTASKTSEYDGPIDIDNSSLRGIDFGRVMNEHSLTFRNVADAGGQLTLRYVPSAAPPTAPTLAGNVPVRWLDYGAGAERDGVYQWYDLDEAHWPLGAADDANSKLVLRLASNRAGLSPATVDFEGNGSLYQGLILITNGRGYARHIPLSLQRGVSAGLWVGDVLVNEVAHTATTGSGDSVSPLPTAQPFSFRVIMHEALGEVTLLTEVTLMSSEVSGLGNVLVTPDVDPAFLDTLIPASLQNGDPFAPRISTAAFSFDDDLLMNGTLGGTVTGTTIIAAEHRLNPFKHRFHPDHDVDNVGESYDITRDFTMTFSPTAPPEFVGAGYGSEVWAGTWDETLSGLHRDPIHVRGSFLIYKISSIPVLNQPSGG